MTNKKNINIEQTEFKELVGDVVEERLVKVFENEKKAKREKKKADDVEKDDNKVQFSLRLKKELKLKVVQLAKEADLSENLMINRMIEVYDPKNVEKLNKKIKTLTNKVNKLQKQLDDIKG